MVPKDVSDTRITLQAHYRDKRGEIHLDFQPWNGTEMPIHFQDDLYRRSGILRLDGKTGSAVMVPTRPYVGDLANPADLSQYLTGWLKTFASNFTFGWSPSPEQMPRYDEQYHANNKYIQGDPVEIEIKKVQAEIIQQLAGPKNCLVGGCSNGELVRRCLEAGFDCFGFDVIPNVEQIGFPEVRGRLREGSLTAIPYSPQDGFDTLVAVDVLEHIPERDIPHMVEEWRRMDFQKLVLLINLNQFWFPGHITLRPLEWWAEQWKDLFRLARVENRFEDLPLVYSNAGRYNQQWTCWERL
jgi:hypothetical protein